MINVRNIRTYFNKKSKKYHTKSISFPWSLIRKFEKKIIFSFLGNVRNLKIADVGSGSGYYSKIIIKKKPKEIYAIDNSAEMLNQIKEKKIKKIKQNSEELIINKKFDKLVCAGLLEFNTNPIKTLKNINKISKKKAILVLLCPKNNFFGKLYRKFHLNNNIKIKLFSTLEIKKLLKKSNWNILKKDEFLFSMIFKLRKND